MTLKYKLLRKIYFKVLKNSTPEFDVKIARNTTAAALVRLKNLGFNPRTILDIGAYHGLWTVSVAGIFRNATFHLFEALPEKKSIIEKNTAHLAVNIHIALLGSEKDREAPFYQMESGSGILPELTDVPRTHSSFTMKRLADFESLNEVKAPVLAKLDVQGYELEVLKGAGHLLSLMDALYLELSVIPYNEGAPSFIQVVSTLDNMGFALFDFGEMHRKGSDDVLIQIDGLFIRKESALYEKATNLRGKKFSVYTD